jgi:hypothetical protein
MKPVYKMKGVGELLEVYEDSLTITPKGLIGLASKGLKGAKTIPFTSITAIQFKKSGLTSGYLQFTLPGGVESRRGVFEAASDENTFMFAGNNRLAMKIKTYIEARMRQLRSLGTSTGNSVSDELQKLAALKEKGVLSDAEFRQAKKRLLG